MIRPSVLAPGCWPGEATLTLFRGSVIIGDPLVVFSVQRSVPRDMSVDGLETTTPSTAKSVHSRHRVAVVQSWAPNLHVNVPDTNTQPQWT